MKKLEKFASRAMKMEIFKHIEHFDGRAILLFSGGRDSCAMVSAYASAFPGSQLILLIFDNGVSSYIELAQKQSVYLQKMFPEIEIICEKRSSRYLMKNVVISSIEENFFGNNFSSLLVCIGCKIVMFYLAALVAREYGVNVVMDGFSERQKHYPEQTKVFMDYVAEFYKKNSLVYISPLYSVFKTNHEIIEYLLCQKLDWCEHQPLCIFGGTYSQPKPEEIKEYLEKAILKIQNSYSFKI